jgi:hypothetical protein
VSQQWRRSGKRKDMIETQFITKIDGFFEFHRCSGKRKDMMKLSLSPKLMVFLSFIGAQEKAKT